MNNLATKYGSDLLPKLLEEFKIANQMAAPKLVKIVINASSVDALGNKEVLEKLVDQLVVISGQKPRLTKAKKSIASFKLKQGDVIGAMVTLRGRRAWDFLEKMIAIVVPRMRDFRGLSEEKFDKMGNYSLGITEQIIFGEIDYAKVDKIRGLVVTIVIENSNPEKSKRFLELLGMPFRK